MTANEALTKLKVMLGLNTDVVETVEKTVIEASEAEVTETIETKFEEATLIDGTVVKVDGDFEVGKPLFVVTEDGDVQAPEGMHQTTSDLLVTVDAEGIITSIEEVEAEEVVEETAPVEEAASEDFSEVVNSIAELVKPALDRINEVATELESLKANFSAFKDEPAGNKITNNLQEFKQTEANKADDRFNRLREIRKNS